MNTPNTPIHRLYGDAYTDDNDDDDLDLTELDPVTSSAPPQRTSYPLRNLRYGGGRRRLRDEEAEDLEALVGGGRKDVKRERDEGEEEEGLLGGGALRGQERAAYDQHRGRVREWIRRYIPSISLPGSHQLSTSTSPDDSSPLTTRVIPLSPSKPPLRYPANAVSNAKYTPWSFLPRTLWNEFKFFFNMYFLLVALSQIIPQLRIGYLSTYIAPLAFVISITLGKEAYDDVYRRKRDAEANGEVYKVLRFEEGAVGESGKGRKRTRSRMSERKKGKRRLVDGEEEGRVESVEREEEETEDVQAPSAVATEVLKPSRDLKVGDVIVLGKDQRVPADVVILKSFSSDTPSPPPSHYSTESNTTLVNASTPSPVLQEEAAAGQPLDDHTTSDDPSGGGEAFIRTDQLDGETDWKLRLASPLAQTLPASEYVRLRVTAGKPERKVNEFIGTIELTPRSLRNKQRAYDPPLPSATTADTVSSAQSPPDETVVSAPLTIDNTAWANTVLASSTTVHAVVIYTGPQTRAALSTSPSRSKTGLLEHEINSLTKILCLLTAALSLILVLLERFDGNTDLAPSPQRKWYVAFTRFLILFSTIVPISLRVNLDMGKSFYAWCIHRDTGIPGTVVRTSTIPEDLGRIEYLLTDKTGTLTRNEMELRKVHVGSVGYGGDAMDEVRSYVRQAFAGVDEEGMEEGMLWTPSTAEQRLKAGEGTTRTRREIGNRVRDLVLALALCHNVTPTSETDAETGEVTTAYQASSPDEIAIVQWTEAVGLRLAHRDRRSITLQSTHTGRTVVKVEILQLFPFTSESKRMGVIVRFLSHTHHSVTKQAERNSGDIVFFQKGADTVMTSIVAANDWLDEETGNMAREGLRTLVVGRKPLTPQQYAAFSSSYSEAALSLSNRDAGMAKAVKLHLEQNLQLLGVTGVEDKLQPHVKPSLELLRNAGIKIWMLTGDKVETARCVAISSKLVRRGQYIHTIANLTRKETALDALNGLHTAHESAALLIDGTSLAVFLKFHQEEFIRVAVRLPAIIACRCSPTQKAEIALLIRSYTGKRIACIGDGGNDVSMIQAADVGVGIVGKEGRQASLAADFSITQFAHLTKLLVWHGRNSYKRSAKLAQFVIHRGLIISVCQTVFSVAGGFEPIALYRDWLLVGYATIYTMFPVFSLVLDRDVDEGLANLYPELYAELTTGRSLSYRTFFTWVGISIYQGLIIQGGAELLSPAYNTATAIPSTQNPEGSLAFKRMVAVSYTALIVNEIVMVAIEITTWHPVMIASIFGTAAAYFGSMPFLGGYFDLGFVGTLGFWWRFAACAAGSLGPVWIGKVVRRRVKPASARKVRGV